MSPAAHYAEADRMLQDLMDTAYNYKEARAIAMEALAHATLACVDANVADEAAALIEAQ